MPPPPTGLDASLPPAAASPAAASPRPGEAAERLAERYLAARGLDLVARNFRCRFGELDLVCLDADVLVIVEVRQRARRDFGGALASVTAAKRRKIIRAAKIFLSRHGQWRAHRVRFDVIGVQGRADAAQDVIWIKAAFGGA